MTMKSEEHLFLPAAETGAGTSLSDAGARVETWELDVLLDSGLPAAIDVCFDPTDRTIHAVRRPRVSDRKVASR
jgi:hypothetical protein